MEHKGEFFIVRYEYICRRSGADSVLDIACE